jgi:MFS superfamily sulfate permease-like transporter
LIGFLTGVGVQVAGGELAGLFGLPNEGSGTVARLVSLFARLGSVHLSTLGISVAIVAVIVGCARLAPRIPGALLAVIGAIIASAWFGFAAHGIATVGNIPGGLPTLVVPTLRINDFHQVLACAGACFIVIVAQSAATARAYALRYEERFALSLDLMGLAGANAAAAFTGTFVVNGSPTKTEMVDEAGGRSQIAHLTAAAVVLVVLLFLTRPLGFLPNAVLSAIVFMIGVKLIDAEGLRELFLLQRNEFWIALATAATVVAFSVMDGIALAVVLSMIDQVRHAYRPRTLLVVKAAEGGWEEVPLAPTRLAVPGVLVYRFESNLFYANAGLYMEEVLSLVSATGEPVRAIILDASRINDVDYTAAKMLLQLRSELAKREIRFASVAVSEGIRDSLRRYGLGSGPGAAGIYRTVDAAIAAVSAEPGS